MMAGRQKGFHNVRAVAPREPTSTLQIYFLAPDYVKSDGDIYGKGAYVLHTLRYYLGDKTFFKVLRRQAYPDPKMEKMTDGKQTRIATTQDFIELTNKVSGKNMNWFFDVYVRQPKLPKLIAEANGNVLSLRWETPDNLPFPMPVDVEMNGQIKRIQMPGGKAILQMPRETKFVVDPNSWVLKEK
jgi:aminopeptidase N